jgi:hypothetical protein
LAVGVGPVPAVGWATQNNEIGFLMTGKIEELLEKIKRLDQELLGEIQKKEREFSYQIKKKRIRFEKDIRAQHRLLVKKIRVYLRETTLLTYLSIPVIWSLIVPALLLDLMISFYQAVCFPIYRIPKVRRRDYVVMDRHYLSYLNVIEKLNCAYCAYFNGVVAYVREVAARTEQYWCPIKHARKLNAIHNRYKNFFDYGDAASYREKVETVRRSFDDVKPVSGGK